MTTKTDLLPCPFCGSTDALRLKNTHTASFWVSCSEEDGGCGAKASGQFFPGPSRRTRFCYDPEAPEGSTFYARTLGELHPEYRRAAKSAIAAWNRRANVAHATAPLQAEIEALRAEVERLNAELVRLEKIAGYGGLASDAPERMILASEVYDGMQSCDKWCEVRRVIDDGQPMPESATPYVRADRAERLAEALRLAEEHINALTPEWYSAGQRVLAEIRAAIDQARGKGEP